MNFLDEKIKKNNFFIFFLKRNISGELEIVFWNIFYISENRINELL